MKRDTLKSIRGAIRRQRIDAGAYDGRFMTRIAQKGRKYTRKNRQDYGGYEEDHDP